MAVLLTETMKLEAAPDRVLEFVTTPERIMDYYPSPIDCGVFEPGESFWCRGTSALTLLERIPEDCSDDCVTLRITACSPSIEPTSPAAITSSPMMTMVEDWQVRPHDGATQLRKTWRDLKKFGIIKLVPMGMIVRRTAKSERDKLIAGWNQAARDT